MSDSKHQLLKLNQTLQMALFERIEELSAKNSQIARERRRFQNLFNLAPVGYLVLDENDVIKEANAASAVMLCSPSKNLVGEDFNNFVQPEFRAAFATHRKESQSRRRQSVELELLPAIKRRFYARLETTLNGDSHYQVAIIDITQRKIAEEALRNSKDELLFLCERLRLETASRLKAEKELRRFALKLIDAQESERQRIARELHDNFGQLMTYLGLLLDKARTRLGPDLYGDAKSIALEVLSGIRNLSADLQPSMLRSVGLGPALQALVDRYKDFTKIKVTFECDPICYELSGDLALAVYRIVQEALTNVARHSGADAVKVTILGISGHLRIEVQDSGSGFVLDQEQESTGLTSMKERAMSLGGSLWIDSDPAQGTIVRAILPFSSIAEHASQQRSEIS